MGEQRAAQKRRILLGNGPACAQTFSRRDQHDGDL
jgi:hypothetical protein